MTDRFQRGLWLAIRAALASSLVVSAGCSHSGGGGGSGASMASTAPGSTHTTTPTPTSTTPGTTTPGSTGTPAPRAPTPAPSIPPPIYTGPHGPLSVPTQGQAEFDKQLASTWAFLLPEIYGMLDKECAKLSNTTQGKLTIGTITVLSKDLSAAPRAVITPIVAGGTYANGEDIQIQLPQNGKAWELEVKANVGYKVLFLNLSEDITVNVTNLTASEDLQLDTTDPTMPVAKKVGQIQLNYNLSITTGSSLINALTGLLSPVINGLIHSQISNILSTLDSQLAGIQGLPSATGIWGIGAPPTPAFGSQPDLQKFALQCSTDVQSVHTPWNTVLTTVLSSPTYGQGTPTSYGGHGDSAIWTGHYLAGEAFRFAVTKDPAALANAQKVIGGITDLLDAETPGDGHLSRCIMPASDPQAQQALANDPSAFATTLHGQPYVGLDHISRDQHIGVMHGLGCAYDFLDDPATKNSAAQLIQRIVKYLVRNSWNAMQHDNVTISAPFVQSPEQMIAFSLLAAHTSSSFQSLADEVGDLSYIEWVAGWDGFLDPLSSYYGWNLGHGATYHAMRLETDPNRYAALQRAQAMTLRAVGHHENAYFQTVDTALDPTLAAKYSPMILDELRRFTAYGRRARAVTNSTDPTIQQGTYSAPLSFQKNSAGVGSLTAVTQTVAKYPIPVEKRVSTDFLWQRSPFELDGGGNPNEQAPGVDMILPYWMAKNYKLIP